MIMSLGPEDPVVEAFKQYNPYYRLDGKSSRTIMG